MKLLRILVSIMLCFSCQTKESKTVGTEFLQFLNPVAQEKILFSYPGRDIPEEKKKEVHRTILRLIQEAKVSIDGYFYSFNDLEMLIALREATNRGVMLNLIGDREEEYEEAKKFSIPIRKWNESGIHHVKVLIFDKTKAFFGTGNFSGHGLIRDNNAYWVWNLKEEEGNRLIEHLELKQKSGDFRSSAGNLIFAPEAGKQIQDILVDSIEKAKFQIQFLIFTHYDPVISYALLRASRRGVKVEGIYNQPINPEGQWLSKHLSFPSQIYLEENEDFEIRNGVFYGGLLHHKTMIIDNTNVLVGSYNYTVSARDDNRELFTSFQNPAIVQEFAREWARVKSHSRTLNSEDNPEDMHSYNVTEYALGGETFFGLWRRKGNSPWDKNSSGLSSEIRLSLAHDGRGFLESEERFISKSETATEFESLFRVREPLPIQSLRLNPTSYDIVLPTPFPDFSVWDGKTKPVQLRPNIILVENRAIHRFPASFRAELAKGQFVVAQGEGGAGYFCSMGVGRNLPKFIEYLLQRISRKGGERRDCLLFSI